MNIIFSSYDSLKNPNYGGGGAIALHQLAKRMALNNNIKYITGAYINSRNSCTFEGVNYIFIGSSRINPILNQLVYVLLLPLYVLRMKYDIWIESFTPPFSTAFLPLFTKKPVIGVTHFFNAEEKSQEYKLPFTWIQTTGIKLYKYIIVLTSFQKKKIRKINEKSIIKLIPNATDIFPRSKVNNKPNNYILFIGRLEIYQKGLDLLFSAFSSIKESNKYKLLIAGSGQENEIRKISLLIKKYSLEKKVILLGHVEGVKKIELLRNANCLVLPSRFEGQSLTAIEAIVSGTPIVCFDIDGLKWIPKNIALKTKAFDLEKFKDNLQEIIINQKLRSKLSALSLKNANNYTWDSVANKYNKFIEDILNKNYENPHHK